MTVTHGHVVVKFIGILPDGTTGTTLVNCQATECDGEIGLFTPMIREYARRQLGVPFGQKIQGFTWYPVGKFIPANY